MLDNAKSIQKAIDHVLFDHKRQKIGFISGAQSNWEALVRQKTFEENMLLHNRSVEGLIYEGDFLEDAGRRAVDAFMANGQPFPDAIIASNDDMAIGAYLRLQELGLKVPKDVSIIGFDNIEKSAAFFPPFTTINQPIFQMAYKALEVIDDVIKGKSVSQNTLFSGELIVRESCGCFNIMKGKRDKALVLFKEMDSYEEALENLRISMINLEGPFSELLLGQMGLGAAELLEYQLLSNTLLQGFLTDLQNEKVEGNFLTTLNYILNYTLTVKKRECEWKEVLFSIRNFLLRQIKNHKMMCIAQDIFYMASILLGNFLMGREMLHNFYFVQMYIMSRKVIKDFNAVIYQEQLTEILKSTMLQYGISQYYLCLYDTPVLHERDEAFNFPDQTQLVIGCHNGETFQKRYFRTKEMLPSCYLGDSERADLIFYVLFSENEHYGYIVFNLNEVDMQLFETLRDQISNALKSQNLFDQRKKAEIQLSLAVNKLEKYNRKLQDLSTHDELTGLFNRRGFYELAESYYAEARLSGLKFFVLFGDLDNLKGINDRFGHNEGDFAIVSAARILQKSFRKGDVIARMSGDEFTVIIEDIESDKIIDLIAHLKRSFNQFNETSGKPYKVTMSMGYSSYSLNSMDTLDDLIKKADYLLYVDKKSKT